MPPERGPAYTRTMIDVPIALLGFLDQAGAVTFLLSRVIGFRGTLEKAIFIPSSTGAGAAATQAIRVRKGNATGAILATVTATVANAVLGGAGVEGLVSAADMSLGGAQAGAQFNDTDTVSITKDAGTVFTAVSGSLMLQFRQRLQARA